MANDSQLSLKQILDAFSHLYPNIAFKFCTSSYEWIVDSVTYNTAFCSMVHANRALGSKCSACDRKGLDIALSTRRPLCYKCHMGLTEFVYPVVKEERGLGVFFVGQFLPRPPGGDDLAALARLCAANGLEYEKMREAYGRLRVLGEAQLLDFSALLRLCAYYIVSHSPLLLDDQSVVKKVDDYLNQHLAEHLSLEKVAQQVNLSPTYLSTVYKKRTQMTLFKSIQKKRISYACFLLRNSVKSISEIALDVGLNDQNYFAHLFKEHMHVTPRYYRANWENMEKGHNLQIYFLPGRP